MPEDDIRLRRLEQENARLRRAVEELQVLNDLAGAIGASLDLEAIIGQIVRRSVEAVRATQGVLTLVDDASSSPGRTLVRTSASSGTGSVYRLNESLLGWMMHHKQPLLVNDPAGDPRFDGVPADASITSVLAVPVMARARLIGTLTVFNKKHAEGFSADDQRLLAILAGQSAQVIENARLYDEEKALVRMREQLRLASVIQRGLLPEQPPELPGYELAGTSLPAERVGGDCFDYLAVDTRRVGISVGDVSGKGLPAALLMAGIQATLRGQLLGRQDALAPATCLANTNRLLYDRIRRGTFVTLFYGVLDAETHRFRYANAGHNRPLLARAGAAPQPLRLGGPALGLLPAAPYTEAEIALAPGDVLLVYSDGVTEAMNAAHDQFGEARLADLLHAHAAEPAESILRHITDAVGRHAGAHPRSDDLTLVVLKRTAP